MGINLRKIKIVKDEMGYVMASWVSKPVVQKAMKFFDRNPAAKMGARRMVMVGGAAVITGIFGAMVLDPNTQVFAAEVSDMPMSDPSMAMPDNTVMATGDQMAVAEPATVQDVAPVSEVQAGDVALQSTDVEPQNVESQVVEATSQTVEAQTVSEPVEQVEQTMQTESVEQVEQTMQTESVEQTELQNSADVQGQTNEPSLEETNDNVTPLTETTDENYLDIESWVPGQVDENGNATISGDSNYIVVTTPDGQTVVWTAPGQTQGGLDSENQDTFFDNFNDSVVKDPNFNLDKDNTVFVTGEGEISYQTPVLDENGESVLLYPSVDENGNFLRDENGDLVYNSTTPIDGFDPIVKTETTVIGTVVKGEDGNYQVHMNGDNEFVASGEHTDKEYEDPNKNYQTEKPIEPTPEEPTPEEPTPEEPTPEEPTPEEPTPEEPTPEEPTPEEPTPEEPTPEEPTPEEPTPEEIIEEEPKGYGGPSKQPGAVAKTGDESNTLDAQNMAMGAGVAGAVALGAGAMYAYHRKNANNFEPDTTNLGKISEAIYTGNLSSLTKEELTAGKEALENAKQTYSMKYDNLVMQYMNNMEEGKVSLRR